MAPIIIKSNAIQNIVAKGLVLLILEGYANFAFLRFLPNFILRTFYFHFTFFIYNIIKLST